MLKRFKLLRVKKTISTNKFPFDYEPNIWHSIVNHTNCYAYALNSVYPEKSNTNDIYYVGAFSGYDIQTYYFRDDLLERLYADFNYLGLKIRESFLDEVVPKDCYKICFLSSGFDFHFFRYDNQGFWSHKQGWKYLPTNKYNDQIITDPAMAKRDYDIIGYYIISK